MGLVQMHPCSFVALFLTLLVFVSGTGVFLNARAGYSRVLRDRVELEGRLRSLQTEGPAPTESNLAAVREDVRRFGSELHLLEADLAGEGRDVEMSDPVRLMAAIQEHLAGFRQRLQLADPPVRTPECFAFGFERYRHESRPPAEVFVPLLDRQRRILACLLEGLLRSGPESITQVRRECIEAADAEGKREAFRIHPPVSLRIPGRVDTLAFQIGFTGSTDALRCFLNELAVLEMPVVVRSLEVRRVDKAADAKKVEGENRFGIFDRDGGRTKEQVPVIGETRSEFILTLEFIERVRIPEEPFAEHE